MFCISQIQRLALPCQLFVILLTRTTRLMMRSLYLDLSEFCYQLSEDLNSSNSPHYELHISRDLQDLQRVLTTKKEKADFMLVLPQ